jgi:cytochrome c556
MRHRLGVLLRAAGAAVLVATAAVAQASNDDKAAYELRDDTMRQLGRNLYLGIGRVVQGKAPYGPNTVAAAEAADRLIATLPNLFPPGSDVPPSRMRSQLLAPDSGRDALIAMVQNASAGLVTAVKGGDKDTMAAAFKVVNDACTACHTRFRNDN